MTNKSETAARPLGVVHAWLRLGGGLLLAIFAVGVAAGTIAASQEQGEFGSGGVVGIGLALACLAVGAWLMLSVRNRFDLPRSPRVRKSRIALYISLGIGALLGAMVGMGGHLSGGIHGDPGDTAAILFGSSPISAALALFALAAWAIAIAASLYWHVSLDEIERAEYDFGMASAMYAYVLVAPGWWIAWRGGLVPEPDGVAIFILVCVVWCVGWGWRRFR